jgi:hypothetical protein
VGWDFGYCGHYWPIVPAPDDRWWWLWRNWWNEDWQGKPKYSEETCPSATLSTTNPTWLDPVLNILNVSNNTSILNKSILLYKHSLLPGSIATCFESDGSSWGNHYMNMSLVIGLFTDMDPEQSFTNFWFRLSIIPIVKFKL